MEVPTQNLGIFAIMSLALGGVVIYAARRNGRRAALLSAGWAVMVLAILAWTGFHSYVGEPLATILMAAAIPAFALIAISVLRTMRRWLSDDA